MANKPKKSTKKPAKKSTAKPAKAKAKKPVKAAAKSAKAAKKQPAKQHAAKKPVAKKAAKPAKVAPAGVTHLAGKAMIIQILGDAEAYFIDFARLSAARRDELIAHHLAAFDQRKKAEGKHDWHAQFVPIALLGESMPPPIRGQFDLSAPHEGVVLHHPASGALLYAASKDDDKLAILAPDLETISPNESFVSEVFDPETQSYAYVVDRTESNGFTLGEIATLMQVAGAELVLV